MLVCVHTFTVKSIKSVGIPLSFLVIIEVLLVYHDLEDVYFAERPIKDTLEIEILGSC